MSFDAGTGNLVLFGGYSEGSSKKDTWSWDGSNWTKVTTATSPPGREHGTMAYDAEIEGIVLFGGYSGSSGNLGDTWVYEVVADPPVATISSPAAGGTYTVGQSVPTAFSCQAGASGPAIGSCTDSNGSTTGVGHLDTSTPGAHTYSVTAIAAGGEEGKASISYTVAAPTSRRPVPPTPPVSDAQVGTAAALGPDHPQPEPPAPAEPEGRPPLHLPLLRRRLPRDLQVQPRRQAVHRLSRAEGLPEPEAGTPRLRGEGDRRRRSVGGAEGHLHRGEAPEQLARTPTA